MFARKRKKKWPIALAAVLLLLMTAAGALWHVGRTLTLRLQLNGDASITLEYGTFYRNTGATAVVQTPMIPNYSLEVPVVCQGTVDAYTVGAYALSYRADFLWLSDFALQVVQIVDTQKPTITLTEADGDYTLPGSDYQELGFSAYDDYDGDITHLVTWSYKENVITYMVSDSSGNYAIAQRIVNYDDPVAPELTLHDGNAVTVYLGRDYHDPGFAATDNFDGDITSKVTVNGHVDVHTPGIYVISYAVTDSFGNTASVQRTVTVAACPKPETVVPEGKVIYLTFDDGPSQHTPRLLEILKKYNVKAAFFVVNNRYADMITQIHEQGHTIGVHTSSHVYSDIYSSESAYFSDFKKVHDLIFEKTGIKTTLMRFPGGSSNYVSTYYNKGIMTRLSKTVVDYGLQYFDWNVNSGDAGSVKTAEAVFRNVINGVSANQYSVVLQHDIHSYSVDAVERIIQWGLANGYTFLPLQPNSPPCHQTIVN